MPGLIAMTMVQQAYNNNASSIYQARSDRYVHDVLSAPMHPWQMNLGWNLGGVARGFVIGAASSRSRYRSPACRSSTRTCCCSPRSSR